MMYLWGTTRSKQPVSDHINLLTLQYSKAEVELKFKGLVQILNTISCDVTYEELIQNKRLYSVIVSMLDYFATTRNNKHLTYDFVSKSYLAFITFYSSLIDDDMITSEEKFAVLDDIFLRLEKEIVVRLPYMSVEELKDFDFKVKKMLKNFSNFHNKKKVLVPLDILSLNTPYSKLQYSDDQLRKVVFDGWMERYYHKVENDDDCLIQAVSPIADDVEKSLWGYAEKERIDLLRVSVIVPQLSVATRAMVFFFSFLDTVTKNVVKRGNSYQKNNTIQTKENEIFRHFWQVFDKKSSIWIVPSSDFKEILKIL